MLCALIQNNAVCGIVDLDDTTMYRIGNLFEAIVDISAITPQPQIGWAFSNGQISNTAPSMKITRLAMNNRFQVAELLAIMAYTNSNPTSMVAVLMQRLQLATYIDLNRSDTQAGVEYLVSQGLLTSDRATAILTTPPSSDEAYIG
jgi:hypothetical protein